jgi:hypothetical protein
VPRTTDSLEEKLCAALEQVRQSFVAALDDPAGEPFVALETQLRIDQVREIFATPADPSIWEQRDGKHYISTASPVGIDYLGFYVGREVNLSADSFVIFTADLVRGRMRFYAPEYDIAEFFNLVVAEPYHHPEHKLLVWLTAAHLLASDRGDDNLYAALPGLVTSHDILHEELPADAPPYAAKLRPAASSAIDLGELLTAVLPQSATLIAESTAEERAALLTTKQAELEDYVRDNVLVRVNELLD